MENCVEITQNSDVASLYAQASVVAILRVSRERVVFPLWIIEAITAGVPLIVARINGWDQIVDGCGLVVEPRDERALAVAIEKMLSNKVLYHRCVEGCRKKAQEVDSMKTLEKLYISLKDTAANV